MKQSLKLEQRLKCKKWSGVQKLKWRLKCKKMEQSPKIRTEVEM
jgi:hypothetical protein